MNSLLSQFLKIIPVFLATLLSHFCFSQSSYYKEPYRLQFHFTPPEKWMNDPNGLVFFNGKYHLFYQYYPEDIIWGPMHWGHAISPDLLHWEHLPIALYPDKLGWIFSGSAVIDKDNTAGFGKDTMIAVFTYHNDEIWKSGNKNTESQGLAYSLDEGKTWTKYADNPVLNNSGEQDFRDPKVFWNTTISKWNMVLAVGDKIKVFSSPNLKQWQFESDFKPQIDEKELGVWECPDLFPMKVASSDETKWVMVVNHGDHAPNGGSGTRYFVGDFDGKIFTPKQKAVWMDYGMDFYAAVTFSNVPDEKKILLGWMSNWKYAIKVPTEKWRSAMTLPREMTLRKEKDTYFITQNPISQYAELLKPVLDIDNVSMPYLKKEIDFSQTEVNVTMGEVKDVIFSFSNTKGEVFTVTISGNNVITDRSNSGIKEFSEHFAAKPQVMPIGTEKITSVQMILDKSSIEILLNDGKYSMTNLFFPTEDYSILSVITKDNLPLKKIKINQVSGVWDK